MAGRWSSWLSGLVLALPLVALAAWIARGALAPARADLPEPIDLPAPRLEERVDGAADALRAAGCQRLLYWRLASPPADAEALFFTSVEGARAVLEREAGRDRTAGPGDEAQVTAQSVYFRRGRVLVRVFLDPGTGTAGELLNAAERLERRLPPAPE